MRLQNRRRGMARQRLRRGGRIERGITRGIGFWSAIDLTRKLDAFADYYNAHRVHRSLDGITPA
jgi:hypothetical protein